MQRAPRRAHVRDSRVYTAPECTQQVAPASAPVCTNQLLECTYNGTHPAPSCGILPPENTQATAHTAPFIAPSAPMLRQACAFDGPIRYLSVTRCFWGTLMAHRGPKHGCSRGRPHHLVGLCPHRAQAALGTAMYAPVAGVHMQAGWLIGAALQPLGMRGQTRRSQSDALCCQGCAIWCTLLMRQMLKTPQITSKVSLQVGTYPLD